MSHDAAMQELVADPVVVQSAATWTERERTHRERVDALVSGHLRRRDRGERHPVEDFLFTYYSHRPAQLRRWHPGFGTALAGDPPHAGWPGYVRTSAGVTLDSAYVQRRAGTVRWIRDLLAATAARPAFTGCLGLHEWAMVYRSRETRHEAWPLRLGPAGTDAVVESHQIRCSHFDAYRFFTADAAPRNALRPSRHRQPELEQPGCLHANMDLYKWAYKLSPMVPSELVTDAFTLAREVRKLDMRASPYDLTELGYEPVRIETPEGKREYAAAQRSFAERSVPLRARLTSECDRLLALTGE
ncbi:MAG TPA: 3-methyladenine DNA glycosylase [Jiangellaceae bacterium]|nr:3-methyladenine DNA glycosylase [Jiangellaceae bacterium]